MPMLALIGHRFICVECQQVVEIPREIMMTEAYDALVAGHGWLSVIVRSDKHEINDVFCCKACLERYLGKHF